MGIPQVECAVALHATKFWHLVGSSATPIHKAVLVAVPYSAAGQAASALHTMATLSIPKYSMQGSYEPGLMHKLRTVTDFDESHAARQCPPWDE